MAHSGRFVIAIWLVASATDAHAQQRAPIIDMHMHARIAVQRAADGSVMPRPCDPQPCTSPPATFTTDESVLQGTIAAMDRYNIVLGLLGDAAARVDQWMSKVPARSRFLPEPIRVVREHRG